MTDLANAAKIFTVAELTRCIRGLLETRFATVWVQGEVSNFRQLPSGHRYFTLKDQRAAISCVIFRNTFPPVSQSLGDGRQVQVYGQVTVFETRGQYQLNVQILQPRGFGLLQAKFEALKNKLKAEGLFDEARKRPLPKFPRRIGIITSPTGAAVRDILNTLRRRARGVEVLINPVRVQGVGAAQEIATAIREFNSPNESWEAVDVLVLARGGGSIEDLWEFNEEIVARAIFHSTIPIVAAVGHEIDFTIADFVADLRAPTPSAAAELIVPDVRDLERRLRELQSCLEKCWRNFLQRTQRRLGAISEKTLSRELRQLLRDAQQQIDSSRETLRRTTAQRLTSERTRLTKSVAGLKANHPARELAVRKQKLEHVGRLLMETTHIRLTNAQRRRERGAMMLRLLGPQATLERGYSITQGPDGRIIRTIQSIRPRMRIRTRLKDGEFDSLSD